MKKLTTRGYMAGGMRLKDAPAVHVADSPAQLAMVSEYLNHVLMTRVRRYAHRDAEVVVLEDRGSILRVSVGGMLGWCLRSELETVES